MTQDEIIEMAKQIGFDEHHAKFDTRIQAFAKLVAARILMNIDPSSFMSHQEGMEAGRMAEREACAKVADYYSMHDQDTPSDIAEAIRARGNT
jgi:hypothetical protein